uniref:Uncharacterized protein n=1 Tax=Triticum urartu TaxID=4572 RepID=A0A8R7UA13_TRIUA
MESHTYTHTYEVWIGEPIIPSSLPHVLEGGVEAGEDEEEEDDHGDAPGGAALGGRGRVAPPAALGGVEAEVALEGVDGGDPADEEDERDGHAQQEPAELLRRLLHELLVGEEPRRPQQQRHHHQDQDHRVRQRRQRERLQHRRLPAPVVVRHGCLAASLCCLAWRAFVWPARWGKWKGEVGG